jgi:hypothetical protein
MSWRHIVNTTDDEVTLEHKADTQTRAFVGQVINPNMSYEAGIVEVTHTEPHTFYLISARHTTSLKVQLEATEAPAAVLVSYQHTRYGRTSFVVAHKGTNQGSVTVKWKVTVLANPAPA